MKCPRYRSDDIEVTVQDHVTPEEGRRQGYSAGYVEIELECNVCEDVVAFYRIKDEDWIEA